MFDSIVIFTQFMSLKVEAIHISCFSWTKDSKKGIIF